MRNVLLLAFALTFSACNAALDDAGASLRDGATDSQTHHGKVAAELEALKAALKALNIPEDVLNNALEEARKRGAKFDDGTQTERGVRIYTMTQMLDVLIASITDPETLLNIIKEMIRTGNKSDPDFGAYFLPEVLQKGYPALKFDLVGRLSAFVVLETKDVNHTGTLLTANTANAGDGKAFKLVDGPTTARAQLIFVLGAVIKAIGTTKEKVEPFLKDLAAEVRIQALIGDKPRLSSTFAASVYLAFGGTGNDDPTEAFNAMLYFFEQLKGELTANIKYVRMTLGRDLFLAGFNISDLSRFLFILNQYLKGAAGGNSDSDFDCGPDYTLQSGTCVRLLTPPPGFSVPDNLLFPNTITFAFGPTKADGLQLSDVPTKIQNLCDYRVYGRCLQTEGNELAWKTVLMPKRSESDKIVACGSANGFLYPGIGITEDGTGLFPAPGQFDATTFTLVMCGAEAAQDPQPISMTVCNQCTVPIHDARITATGMIETFSIDPNKEKAEADKCVKYDSPDGLLDLAYGYTAKFKDGRFTVCGGLTERRVCNYFPNKEMHGYCLNIADNEQQWTTVKPATDGVPECIQCWTTNDMLAPDSEAEGHYDYVNAAKDSRPGMEDDRFRTLRLAPPKSCADDKRYPREAACTTATSDQILLIDFIPMTAPDKLKEGLCCFAEPDFKGIVYKRVCNNCPAPAHITGCYPDADEQDASLYPPLEVLPGECGSCGTRTGKLDKSQVKESAFSQQTRWDDIYHLELCH